jgi:hypothetical protein
MAPRAERPVFTWLRKCSPAATIVSGRDKLAGLAPGQTETMHAGGHVDPESSTDPLQKNCMATPADGSDARYRRAQTGSVDLPDKADCRECCSPATAIR